MGGVGDAFDGNLDSNDGISEGEGDGWGLSVGNRVGFESDCWKWEQKYKGITFRGEVS
jgi:hypothetical protein